MAILNLQRRSRELGRIRIGQQVAVGTAGKTRPTKLDRFRLTSASRALLDKAAALYGGEVIEWINGGVTQYEVITTATRLPVLVPPQPVSQYYELWSGGGCQRRCDGETELLTDKACLCSPDPEERECKPTTRLNVVLRDVEGVGVWRLETHGYYAATELPSTAEFLAKGGGYIAGWLSLEERLIKRAGQTRRFMVPILEVDITPAALMAGDSPPAVLSAAAPTPQLPAAVTPAGPVVTPQDIADAADLDQLRALYTRARAAGHLNEALASALAARAAGLEQPPAVEPSEPAASAAPLTPTEFDPSRSNPGSWHDHGHPHAGRILAWHPACTLPACTTDWAGKQHHEEHHEPDEDCEYCRKETVLRAKAAVPIITGGEPDDA
jgi:hypothetical protein